MGHSAVCILGCKRELTRVQVVAAADADPQTLRINCPHCGSTLNPRLLVPNGERGGVPWYCTAARLEAEAARHVAKNVPALEAHDLRCFSAAHLAEYDPGFYWSAVDQFGSYRAAWRHLFKSAAVVRLTSPTTGLRLQDGVYSFIIINLPIFDDLPVQAPPAPAAAVAVAAAAAAAAPADEAKAAEAAKPKRKRAPAAAKLAHEARCSKCRHHLTRREVLAAASDNAHRTTTRCPKCKHRVRAQLLPIGWKHGVTWYFPAQLDAAFAAYVAKNRDRILSLDFSCFTATTVIAADGGLYWSAVDRHGNYRAALRHCLTQDAVKKIMTDAEDEKPLALPPSLLRNAVFDDLPVRAPIVSDSDSEDEPRAKRPKPA